MQIEFQKEQITEKSNSIMINYGEYKLSVPNWMIKNNSFIVDDKYTYWVFNLENIKKELIGMELKELLKPYINSQKITINQPPAKKEYYINKIKLEELTFYEEHNGWFIGEIKDPKTNIINSCFKYNVKWVENNKAYKIIEYNHNDLPTNYLITPYKDINTHSKNTFYVN
ncbi:hypothetical protein [Spiroplasma endosymbiont of Nebria brevicollis]|uniref:hypothetical protein n=1 Tax=Spiroplasma endosymbiont of Nebria brevicollis TaxID=3066284 RepID=UPI00313E69A3